MVGGFSYSQSEFNRATQAMRQPGSSFKPIVYAAALDNGYTPASVIMDGPITIQSGNTTWTPKNYDGRAAGPSTLRSGIERSRNLMTVRLANDMGMKLVAEYAERFGVYDKLAPYLPMSLGSGETTVMRMVSAYAIMANGGRSIKPSLIDRIQDRYGKTVFRHDDRGCEGCNASEWQNQPEPELVDNAEQVLDPMTAYQITSMMVGVVQRGTATSVAELGRHIAGKTGTTNDEKDAWFIGYAPNLGVALDGTPNVDFKVPEGMNLVSIDRKTGMQAAPGQPGTIVEAFKPGTGPADSYWVIGMGEDGSNGYGEALSPQASQAIQSGGGGLY
jgi:penicillin-binding protein 1A